MKILTRFVPVILTLAVLLSMSITAQAAVIEQADTKAQYNGSLLAADFEVSGTTLEPGIALPQSYSSLELGLTTPVRSQIYNTCWAYGSSATLETKLLKDGLPVEHFAPMHMNYWGTKHEDGTGWARTYTGGGYAYISLGYFTSWQGPRLESDFSEHTSFSDYDIFNAISPKQVGVNSVIYLTGSDIDTIKTAVYEHGAVVGNYHVDESCYNSSTASYHCNIEGLTTAQMNGHCISVVGWDDNYPKENFNEVSRPESNGAWLCKNSWGSYWGKSGYYWISYEDEYLFSDKFGNGYAFTGYELYDPSRTLYQNEVDGATYEFDYITNFNTITYINVFDTDEGFTLIDKINFESTAQGASYVIYHIPVDTDGTPIKNMSYWTQIGSGTVDYKGYHSIDTTDFTLSDSKFAIGIAMTKSGGSGNSVGVCEWLSTGEDNYIFTPATQKGESYLMLGSSTMMDLLDFYSYYEDDDIGGTFVIKAIGETSVLLGDVDMDDRLSILDATYIQRYLAELDEFNSKQKKCADTDGDGLISIYDATKIQLTLAGSGSDFDDSEDF